MARLDLWLGRDGRTKGRALKIELLFTETIILTTNHHHNVDNCRGRRWSLQW